MCEDHATRVRAHAFGEPDSEHPASRVGGQPHPQGGRGQGVHGYSTTHSHSRREAGEAPIPGGQDDRWGLQSFLPTVPRGVAEGDRRRRWARETHHAPTFHGPS